MLGLKNFEADFRYFAKMPSSEVNISGLGKASPVKFSGFVKPSPQIQKMYRDPRSRGVCGWGSPTKIEKIAKVRFCRGCGGKVYRGMDPMLGKFCRHASLLMLTSNVARRCCTVPPLGGFDRGTIENYPCLLYTSDAADE